MSQKDRSRRSSGDKPPGRYSPNYHPSGKGTYNTRWRKEERRTAAVDRQRGLCESGATVQRNRQGEPDFDNHDYGKYIEAKEPLDWKMMLPKSMREGEKK